jgi:hypothetical protein
MCLVSACAQDPDQGIEDPDRLEVKALSGLNYAGSRIYDVGPLCEGKSCPSPDKYQSAKIYVDVYDRCIQTADALDETVARRGAEEWCKISPLAANSGVDFFFNNLLEPNSVEFVRGQIENPLLKEAYTARTGTLRVDGPTTRYHGDYIIGGASNPDTVDRLVNLTCVENLQFPVSGGAGIEVNAEFLKANPLACSDFYEADGKLVPLKMQVLDRGADNQPTQDEPHFRANNSTTSNYGADCTGSGAVDTCCTSCDYELSVNVARYGRMDLTPEQAASLEDPSLAPVQRRSYDEAIKCDPKGNVLLECQGFVPYVDRTFETGLFSYDWDGDGEAVNHRIADFDRIRETHPTLRGNRETNLHACSPGTDECNVAGLAGTSCIGLTADNELCDDATDSGCSFACRATWIVDCSSGVDGTSQGYCVDHRFVPRAAPGCLYADGSNPTSASSRLSNLDRNGDGNIDVSESCSGSACDPSSPPGFSPIPNYDRSAKTPPINRICRCIDPDSDEAKVNIDEKTTYLDLCGDLMKDVCKDADGNPLTDGRYAKRFVDRAPGLRMDPSVKGIRFFPADLGGITRAHAEQCAVQSALLQQPTIQDGWNTSYVAFQERVSNETLEDFDRGFCSGSEYRAVFSTSDDEQFIEDKIGNTLDGHAVYVFRTPEFHVRPNSGFPADHLQITGCNDFSLSFSNKYDLSPENMAKIQIWSLKPRSECVVDGIVPREQRLDPKCWIPQARAAGGSDCSKDPAEVEGGKIPCLSVSVKGQFEGELTFFYDREAFTGENPFHPIDVANDRWGRYRVVVPGLGFDSETGVNLGAESGSSPYVSLEALTNAKPEGWLDSYRGAFHDVCGMPLVTAGGDDFFFDFDVDTPTCDQDLDGDDVAGTCDNAPARANPDQSNFDRDPFGDEEDICPVVAFGNNSDDRDGDGIGGPCDACRKDFDSKNKAGAGVLGSGTWIRPNPYPGDFDGDGIGDVCDNCPTVPNCLGFGNEPGQTAADVTRYWGMDVDSVACQTPAADAKWKGVLGQACESLPNVGFEPTEDFDQDGLANQFDYCTRIPLALGDRIECTTDDDCPAFRRCTETLSGGKICNHFDSDSDGFGDVCDTCAHRPNTMQNDSASAADDDADGDFIGVECELGVECPSRRAGRPLAFYEVSAHGYCCVTTLPADGEKFDPSLPVPLPILRDCPSSEDGRTCRPFPDSILEYSGIGVLPAGCAEALEEAKRCDPHDSVCLMKEGFGPNRRLNVRDEAGDDFIADPAKLWSKLCFLPPSDQDADGIADECDLCPFAFDPRNERYTDANGVTWATYGKFCNGDYDPAKSCEEATDGDTSGSEEQTMTTSAR